MDEPKLWQRLKNYYFHDERTEFSLDISRMHFDSAFLSRIRPRIDQALKEMAALEGGAVSNPDEGRMVGHYWLRDSQRAPSREIRNQIDSTIESVKRFTAAVLAGEIKSSDGTSFESALIIGIGGSALGPQFVYRALGSKGLRLYFFDNTDPDGMEMTLRSIPDLARTLCVVISKSGGTKETRNGQFIAAQALHSLGLDFSKHFVAVTSDGSELYRTATTQKWLATFPMWDWVGGRTSELSAVGLLPAALHGADLDALLAGARHMDVLTRNPDATRNPAASLALMWFYAGGGKGQKSMVVLPYNDRIELFSRYLQQLVMESLGKELDRDGARVDQGLSVYGNKGSTDQHAYVQQLRDGINNFFAVFIEVLKDRSARTSGGALSCEFQAHAFEVDPGVTSGDYLSGFLQGTRRALFEKSRESITITISEVSEFNLGILIALFERAVGLYASLINVNAYHQPGVEAGKKAANEVLQLQSAVLAFLREHSGSYSVEQLARSMDREDATPAIFSILRHLQANGRVKVEGGDALFSRVYTVV